MKRGVLMPRYGEQLPTHSVVIPYEKTLGAEAVKKFEGYISPEEHAKALAEAAAAQKSAELKCMKLNAAIKSGIPVELADKLSGEDEEAIAKEAELFASFIVKAARQPRHFDPEGSALDGVEKAFYERNPALRH